MKINFNKYDIEKSFTRSLLFMLLALVVVAIMSAGLTSCGRRPAPEAVTDIQVKDSSSYTSKEKETVNQAIKDKIALQVPDVNTGNKDCDSLCAADRAAWLRNVNIEKQSGDNRYKLLYNEHTKLLELYIELQETKSQVKEIFKDRYITKKEYYKVTTTVTQTPKFMKWSAYFGWAAALVLILLTVKKARSWLVNRLSL